MQNKIHYNLNPSFEISSNSSYLSFDENDMSYQDLLNNNKKISKQYLNLKQKFKVLLSENETLKLDLVTSVKKMSCLE